MNFTILKTFWVIILVCVGVNQLRAQQQQSAGTLRGRVVDSVSRRPISYVTVALLDNTGRLSKSTLTDDNGVFKIDQPPGKSFRLALAAVGYASQTISSEQLKTSSGTSQTPDFLLSPKSQQLKEVAITAVKPLVKQEADRIVYDIESDPDSRNESMLQMMRKVPFLSLDADDKLLMKGATDYKVLVDGRSTGIMARSPMEALRMMRAQTVKRVEVITSPSAKYDSEGAAGIINIITKQNQVGSLLYLLLHANTRIGRGFESSLTVKKGKFGMYVWSGYWRHDLLVNEFDNLRSNLEPASSTIRQQGWTKTNGYDFPIVADFGYEIDSLNLLNGSFSSGRSLIRNHGNQLFNAFNGSGANQYAYSLDNTNYTDNSSIDFGLNYQMGFKKTKSKILTAAYKFSRSENDFDNDSYNYEISNYPNRQSFQQNTSGMNEQTVQLDYTAPIKKLVSEAGIKFILRDNFSQNTTDNTGAIGASNDVDALDYHQNIAAAYNSYQFNTKKWGFRIGGRFEYTGIDADFISNGSLLDRNFINIVPSVWVNRKINPRLNASVAYTQRIQRPAIWQLNPFVNESNPLYHTTGNPDLDPALFHVGDLSVSRFKKTSYTFNLNYTFARNTIQSVAVMKNDTVALASFQNLGKNSNLGFNLSINHPFSSKLSGSLNWRFRYVLMEGMVNSELFQNDGFAVNGTTGLAFKLPKDLNFSAMFMVNSSQPTLQGNNGGFLMHYIDLQKYYFNKKMLIRANVISPFKKYINVENAFSTGSALQVNTIHRVQRGVYVGVSYTFGELKDKVKKPRTRVNNDDLSAPPKEQ